MQGEETVLHEGFFWGVDTQQPLLWQQSPAVHDAIPSRCTHTPAQ